MTQQKLDTTGNESQYITLDKIDKNFTDLYANEFSGPTGPTGSTGPTGPAIAQTAGTFVANGATPVVVANSAVTANSNIIITLKTVGGTVSPSVPYINTITPTTGFHVTATALDTSTYNYLIID